MNCIRFFILTSLFLMTVEMVSAQVTALGTGTVKESNSNNGSLSMGNFTVPVGNDVLLIVATRNADQIATNITFNGNALTKLNGVTNGIGNSSIWYRVLGNVTTQITADIIMTLPNPSQTKMMVAMCFKNVNQTIPVLDFTSNSFDALATSSSLSNSGVAGDVVYDVISSIGSTSTPPTFTASAGQTTIGTGVSSSQPKRRISASYKPLAGSSTNMGWTVTGSNNGAGIHLSARIQAVAALPVELAGFNATEKPGGVLLKWTTASETDNENFMVQRSLDARSWKELGTVSGAGTTKEVRSYEFIDKNPAAGLNYYRLVQKDFDGKTSFSSVLSVRVADNGSSISISPNPWSSGPCLITVSNLLENQGVLEIIDSQGRIVHQKAVYFEDLEKTVLPVETESLLPGQYFVRLSTKSRQYNSRLLVQSR